MTMIPHSHYYWAGRPRRVLVHGCIRSSRGGAGSHSAIQDAGVSSQHRPKLVA